MLEIRNKCPGDVHYSELLSPEGCNVPWEIVFDNVEVQVIFKVKEAVKFPGTSRTQFVGGDSLKSLLYSSHRP